MSRDRSYRAPHWRHRGRWPSSPVLPPPAPALRSLRGGGRQRGEVRLLRIARQPVHPLAPFVVVVAHPVLVVNGLVLVAAVQDAARLRARQHRRALTGDAEQVLVQVAAERTPDRVVMVNTRLPLLRGVALQAEAPELDHHL